jgi:hypothetical protein
MTTDGQIKDGLELDGGAVLTYLKTYYSGELEIIEKKEKSVVIKISGKMKGTYGLRASYTTSQIA